uniref:Uncharacterized protein n=1 Tax=Anguilla anguilla TaxID=7936 RepID=A0A0E9VP89_ANGAN
MVVHIHSLYLRIFFINFYFHHVEITKPFIHSPHTSGQHKFGTNGFTGVSDQSGVFNCFLSAGAEL